MKALMRRLISRFLDQGASAPPVVPQSVGGDSRPLKMSLFGTCQLEQLTKASPGSPHRVRHMLMESYSHAPIPNPSDDDDLIVVNISLRNLISESSGLPTPASDMIFARMTSAAEAVDLMDRCKAYLTRFLDRLEHAHHTKPVIVTSFFEPGFHYIGALQDQYAPTSMLRFIRELNEKLSDDLRPRPNFRFFDINHVLNRVGREFLHDEVVLHGTHASFINDWNFKLDVNRLSAPRRLHSAMVYERAMRRFAHLFFGEVQTIFRVSEQTNPVKLIICDLDDTLWRGVAAESDGLSDDERIEGWPLGLAEALLFFKRRGGILALCSKNDAEETAGRFMRIFRGALTLDDFAMTRINRNSKSTNVSDILAQVNVLANNTLFIDDNVREVAEVKLHHPEIRCLGFDYYNWRQIVLRAPDLQVPVITDESSGRTALIQATVQRQESASHFAQSAPSRKEWLSSLNLRQSIDFVTDPKSKHYERAFELINKTNQFNTTGQRWSPNEFRNFLEDGGLCLVSRLRDINIDNGIVAVCLIDKHEIRQLVLSCRVFGLEAEVTVVAVAIDIILSRYERATAKLRDTGRNATCHGFFQSLAFEHDGTDFFIDHAIVPPSHIVVSNNAKAKMLS